MDVSLGDIRPRAIAAKIAKILGGDAFTVCFVESRLESASSILKSIDDKRTHRPYVSIHDRYKRDTNVETRRK